MDGEYRLTDVEPGSYTITVRRIGYAKRSQAVTVASGEETTVELALEPVPTRLDEIVTTVTGDQRLRELGHVVGRINADSLMREAPVSTLSELLTARVPGLQVFQDQGTVGGEVRLQVRGPNSVLLRTEPIVIVDGVRYASDAVPNLLGFAGPGNTENTSPLNDINPNDVESIEVVKGPSAATLYGTDAANGVIVVTTKRGRPGPAQWSAYFRGATTEVPAHEYPSKYWGWQTVDGVPSTRSTCVLTLVALGACTQDSLAVLPNPLNDPELTIFGNQPRWETGLSVSGGREDVRYYFAGGFEDANGPVVMPPAALERLEQERGTALPEEWRHPNTRTSLNLRANTTTQLGKTAELSVNAGYIRGATRTLSMNNPYASGAAAGTPENPYSRFSKPEEIFAGQSTERTDRFVGRAAAQWRPASWLLTRATVGLDLGTRNRTSLLRRGDAPNGESAGVAGDDRAREVATTVELGATASARRGRLSARTSVGLQYVRNLLDAFASAGFDLPPGATSVPEAASLLSAQSYAETITLGSYLEETLGLNERLFLTGALRVDGASTFGENYDATVYPKLGASWLASEEPFFPRVPGLDELRLRYAYGASGQQPQPQWARPTYTARPWLVNDEPGPVVGLAGIGNGDLRPERVREHEFGFDATGLRGRVQLGLTWYRRRTADQIIETALPAGYGSTFTNVGLTTQHGFEAEVTARLLDTRLFSWDVIAQHGLHRTKLVDLGGAPELRSSSGGYVEGYSLGARFQWALNYADTNGDGLIDRNELEDPRLNELTYAGESAPPISQSVTTVIGLFDRRVRMSAVVERRAGFTQVNSLKTAQCGAFGCRAAVDPSAPLDEQAQVVVNLIAGTYRYLEPGDFTRLRELTVALDLPPSVARGLGARSATVSLSGRNLALWTDFGGGDPESRSTSPFVTEAGGIPQGRTWMLRFDVGF